MVYMVHAVKEFNAFILTAITSPSSVAGLGHDNCIVREAVELPVHLNS